MKEKDINFIASHYKKNKFSIERGWERMQIPTSSGAYRWKKYGIAATITAVVFLSATATLLYHHYDYGTKTEEVTTTNVGPITEVQIIDFEDTPLIDVVYEVETTYNVTIENLPSNIEDYSLSLHYEGTATELIAVINDILGTQMTVTER